MASIVIQCDVDTALTTIKLDHWEWTGLEVNGYTVPKINAPNLQFEYIQNTAGGIQFVAKANHNLEIVNDPYLSMFIRGKNDEVFCCQIYYVKLPNNAGVELHGMVTGVITSKLTENKEPVTFSQGHMGGLFEVV